MFTLEMRYSYGKGSVHCTIRDTTIHNSTTHTAKNPSTIMNLIRNLIGGREKAIYIDYRHGTYLIELTEEQYNTLKTIFLAGKHSWYNLIQSYETTLDPKVLEQINMKLISKQLFWSPCTQPH
jgi:hypothetical protein